MATTSDTHIPPFEGGERDPSAVQSEPRSGLSETPTSVREHEEALTLRWAELAKALPSLQEDAVLMAEKVRETRREMDAIRRLLLAHKRIRSPRTRKVTA